MSSKRVRKPSQRETEEISRAQVLLWCVRNVGRQSELLSSSLVELSHVDVQAHGEAQQVLELHLNVVTHRRRMVWQAPLKGCVYSPVVVNDSANTKTVGIRAEGHVRYRETHPTSAEST